MFPRPTELLCLYIDRVVRIEKSLDKDEKIQIESNFNKKWCLVAKRMRYQ